MAEARFAIAVGRFYGELADRLVEGATRTFEEAGASVEVHDVPGAYELPLAAKYCAESGRYAGVACLGAVIRARPTTTTTCVRRPRAASPACRSTPACPVPSGC